MNVSQKFHVKFRYFVQNILFGWTYFEGLVRSEGILRIKNGEQTADHMTIN